MSVLCVPNGIVADIKQEIDMPIEEAFDLH